MNNNSSRDMLSSRIINMDMELSKPSPHDDPSLLVVRAETLRIIVKAISQCHIKDLPEDKVIRLARYLEKQLFKSSPNMQSYYNMYTIENHVKQACTVLAYRIIARKKYSQ